MAQQPPSTQWPFMDSGAWREHPITPLVVGDSRALVLGRRAPAGAELRSAPRGQGGPWHWQVIAAGVVTLVAGVLLGLGAARMQPASAESLPLHPIVVRPDVVRVVEAAYVAALPVPGMRELGVAKAAEAGPPLPLPLMAAQREPTRAAPVKPRAAASSPSAAQDASRHAVVLDEAEARAERMQLQTDKPASAAASALIAITPDGQLAVFTNPRTGLPQQFHIGEPLPGGDTIRSIDGGQGKVFTSAREYSLD